MYCNNCGAQLEPGAAFCGNCGTKVVTEPEPKPVPMPESAYEPATAYEPAAAFESAQPYEPAVVFEPAQPYEPAATFEPAQPYEPAATFEPAQPYEPVGGNAVPPVPPMPPAPPMPTGGGAIPQSFGAPMTDWRSSRFEGSTAAHFGMSLVIGLLSALSLGFAVPALKCWYLRWKYRNTVIGGYRLKFNGTGGQLFGKWILWCLLCIVTVGIYTIWMPVKLLEWETKHVEIDSVA